MNKYTKNLIIILSIIFLLIIGSGFYAYNGINKKLLALNIKLETTKDTLEDSITKLDKKITTVDNTLNIKTNSLDNKISGLKEETERSTKALSSLIKEVEQQSNIELEKVKKDIQSVSVSAGDFSQIVENVLPSVVSVITERGRGSGAFITDKGHVVTNLHVIESANKIRIYTYDKKLFDAVVEGVDPSIDIAVLKINASYNPLEFDDSEQVKAGEKVIALGNPVGLDFTVTEGIISATNRKVSKSPIGYIQIDVALNPGNSGGPLVNTQGKIIGINNFKVGGGFEALGFAIPSNVVKEYVKRVV